MVYALDHSADRRNVRNGAMGQTRMTSTQASTTAGETTPASRRLTGNLGTFSIIFMVIAAAAPLTVVGGVMPGAFLVGNGIGLPITFVVVAGILMLFSVGLISMSKHVPGSGAFFTYISHGLGRTPGVAASWLAVLTYTTVQASVFSLLGGTISSSIVMIGGPDVPWWVFAFVAIVIVGVLGYRHIELSSKVLFIALGGELIVGLVLVLVVMVTGGAEGISFGSFSLANILSGSPGIALMFAVASFIGFESAVVYRSEVRNPDRTIPRATLGSAAIIGIFYALTAWALVLGAGESNLIDMAAEDPGALLTRITDTYLGPVGSIIATVLLIGSMFAAALSLHNVLARYFHTMSNSGLLPNALGEVHPKHGAPHKAALTQVTIAGIIMIGIVISGLDPIAVLSLFAGIGTIALVLLMAATSISAIAYSLRNRTERNAWKAWIAPLLGFLGLATLAVLILSNVPLMVGDVNEAGEPTWGMPSLITLVVVVVMPIIGLVQASILRTQNPTAYARITEGLDSE